MLSTNQAATLRRETKPPDLPDGGAIHTFKDILMSNGNELTVTYDAPKNTDMELETSSDSEDAIQLSTEELERLYKPWRLSVIIKVFGKRFPHTYLQNKLIDLWIPSEPLTLIDLSSEYHIVKFKNEENTNRALDEGPWFIAGKFVSVQKWEPNFVPQESSLSHTAIWV